MAAAIDTLVDAAPDAIQLSVGQADLLQRHPGRDKPALVLRTDTPNVYAPEPPAEAWSFMIDDPVGQAVRLDAACVVVNLLDVPGQDGLRRDCLEAISHLRAECDRAGMPLMVEPLAFDPGEGGYAGSGDVDRICGDRPPGRRARRRHHQGRPDRRPRRLPPRRHRRARAAARPRRRPGHRPGDPRAHARAARAGRGRDRLRPQRDPARQPGGDDARADVGRPRGRDARAGAGRR